MAVGNRDERDLPISDATQELGGLKRNAPDIPQAPRKESYWR
jgi:hypothetical protein